MLISRRSVLVAASLTAAARPAWAQNLSRGVFTHGVASGDPLSDGVVLWTRFIGGDGRIGWEIAEDDSFANVTQRGVTRASIVNDYCAKVDVRGLAPGRRIARMPEDDELAALEAERFPRLHAALKRSQGTGPA